MLDAEVSVWVTSIGMSYVLRDRIMLFALFDFTVINLGWLTQELSLRVHALGMSQCFVYYDQLFTGNLSLPFSVCVWVHIWDV